MVETSTKLYSVLNNVSGVAASLNERGYKQKGKFVVGKRTQINIKSNDITEILHRQVIECGQSDGIVNKFRSRKGISI